MCDPSCCVRAARCLQFLSAAGWGWSIAFSVHCFWLWLSSCDLPWACLFDLLVYHYILDFKIWKCVVMMGVSPRLMAMFKIFAISANPTTWRPIPFVLGSSCGARWCEDKWLLCFLVVACSDTGQSLIEGGYHISFPHAKHLIQVFYSQSPAVDFRTFSGLIFVLGGVFLVFLSYYLI